MKRLSVVFFTLCIVVLSSGISGKTAFVSADLMTEMMNSKKLRLLPVSKDFRNYFILQSVDNQTNIIVGDFVGSEKKIILIEDHNSDNSIDRVYEYYPDRPENNNIISLPKSTSDLVYDIESMKKDIISGEIFSKNYTYTMRSMSDLVKKINKNEDIYKHQHGYTVKIYDPDNRSTIMGDFFFGRKDGRYYLQFTTNYYKLFHNKIRPLVPQSVYCVNSKDSAVKDAVERLVKLKER